MSTSTADAATRSRSTKPRKGISGSFLWVALSILVLSGCATQQQKGTLIGGVAGALIGSVIGDGSGQNVAIAAGAIAGSLIGSSVGQRFDEQDHDQLSFSLERNERTSWTNSSTGRRYAATPSPNLTPYASNNQCREFTVDTEIGNRAQSAYGTACRQYDGSWKIVSD